VVAVRTAAARPPDPEAEDDVDREVLAIVLTSLLVDT
jgi:hypothetical protein